MTIQLKHHLKDTATLRFTIPDHISSSISEYQFLVKCGMYRVMIEDHPSLSELYKIRYNEHGGLQLNDYQKILKKRFTSLMWDVKEHKDLQIHILIPRYTGNYFSFCVMISSLQVLPTHQRDDEINQNRVFSSYNNFAIRHSNLVTLHLDQMDRIEIQNLFRISCGENNNGDLLFQLSVNAQGIPDILFDQYRTELGVHEIEVIQNIVNFQVKHYDIPLIQLNSTYSRSIGWDQNDQLISITEPQKISTFGNERIMLQALLILQSFYLKHKIRMKEIVNPRNGKRSNKQEMVLVTDQCYLIITSKADLWNSSLQSLQLNNKYSKEIPIFSHNIDDLGLDIIQLFNNNRGVLIEIIRTWVNIVAAKGSAQYEMQSLLELFEDTFKTYGLEQLNEFQLRMYLKQSTFDDLLHEELHNTLVSKYAAIFGHSFFNYKEKVEAGVANTNRQLWKKDFFSLGFHVIDISGSTQTEQMAIQSFFIALQEQRYFKNTWTLHSFDDGLRHSFEKLEQVLRGISVHKSLLHFTHITALPSFIRSHELMLFDRDFSTQRVLKSFDAHILFEESGDSSLLVYEQVDTTLMKPLQPQMLDKLYERNVLVKIAPDQIFFSHDDFPAKVSEVDTTANPETPQSSTNLSSEESVFSRPFSEEEDTIMVEYEEDNYIGPDLMFKIPILATLKSYRQYRFQEIEYGSNLPRDIVEKQLDNLLAQRWIEKTIVDKKDVYLPLGKGKDYVDSFLKEIPQLSTIQQEIFELSYPEADLNEDEKIIDKNNILDVLVAIRILYHDNTDVKYRKDLLIKICSLSRYISDTFAEYDELESYYFWTIGVYVAFLDTQIGNKRDEHLLAIKIGDIVKLIADIINEKLQHDFTNEQIESDTDEVFVFNESMKDEIDEIPSVSISLEEETVKELPQILATPPISQKQRSKSSLPPTVFNIPKASVIIPKSERQSTPQELKPILFDRKIGGWYKYHRIDYDIPVVYDPLTLTPDDIIFAFMVNSMTYKSMESFDIKKETKTLMFLNKDQLINTANRSPLPLNVNYDNLVNSGIIKKLDLGFTITDVRTVLPDPQVNVDPMYKRMSLNEVIDLIDEGDYNVIHSRMIQSYIYAEYYDIELQPVVAICYALLTDTSSTKQKISAYSKFIPWVYTLIKLFLIDKRALIKSNEFSYLHTTFSAELKKIHVESSLDLLGYTGDNDTVITLKFVLQRKLKKLGISSIDITKYSSTITEGKAKESTNTEKVKLKKVDRIKFSPTLIQQIEEEGLLEEKKVIFDKTHSKTQPSNKKVKRTNTIKIKLPTDNELNQLLDSQPSADSEIKLDETTLIAIQTLCAEVIEKADSTSPTDLLINIFSDILYPGITNHHPSIVNLSLIETFNEVGELTGVSNTVDFSRNLGDMQDRWDKFKDTRTRVIKSFVKRIEETASNFVYNELFRNLLRSKIKRSE